MTNSKQAYLFPCDVETISNLYTMNAAAKFDPRQAIPEEPYVLPSEDVRLLRAKLIMEEALETIEALGMEVIHTSGPDGHKMEIRVDPEFSKCNMTELEKVMEIIDGCIDLRYVCCGTLAAMGVQHFFHTAEVCDANNRKFPKGEAVINPITGKFGKPKEWVGPNHMKFAVNPDVPPPSLLEQLAIYGFSALSETKIPLPSVELDDGD